jgi:hypothetical protein
MARGGARPGSGPAPDPMSFRSMHRQARGDALPPGWVVLPVTGRQGDLPEWPLTEATPRELAHWARLWRTPQASEWERLGQELEVGLYVRRLAEVELPGASAAASNLLMRLEEALGLSLPGLQARKWQLGSQQPDLATVTPLRNDPPIGERRSARDRMSRGRLAIDDQAADAAGDED